MDLTRTRLRAVAAAAALASAHAACSSDNPFSFTEDAVLLPATLKEALPIAERIARDWNENAFATRLGGGFTVMDADGRALNHSFQFHGRFGLQFRSLTVHLVSGLPWTQDEIRSSAPPPLDVEAILDSDAVVRVSVLKAADLNALDPGRIPEADAYAARLLSIPVWPEPQFSADSVAWRVDFLELDQVSGGDPTPVWWSLARFYVNPATGQFLGEPDIPPTGRELYPFP